MNVLISKNISFFESVKIVVQYNFELLKFIFDDYASYDDDVAHSTLEDVLHFGTIKAEDEIFLLKLKKNKNVTPRTVRTIDQLIDNIRNENLK